MAEAASISYGNEFSSEPRKSPLNKHIPESSKVRKTPHGLQIRAVTMTDAPLEPVEWWENRPMF